LENAYHNIEGVDGLSHDTAVLMLHGHDRGCRDFMGCLGGRGVFVIEAGDNKLALHQGANDGFRALYLHTYAGPDRGKGFVALANGDFRAVEFIADVARVLIETLEISGVDFQKLKSNFQQKLESDSTPQEHKVNVGYKHLLFSAFLPTRPEEILKVGESSPLAKYNLCVAGDVLSVTNDRFARAENLLSPFEPVFDPELFGRQGKIMDSWESVRHNSEACDALELKMPKASPIAYALLSTKFHDGNQAPAVRLYGRPNAQSPWEEFLPLTALAGHSEIRIKLPKPTATFADIRVEMIPDGGLSRLGLFNELPTDLIQTFLPMQLAKPKRFQDQIPSTSKPLSIPYRYDEAEVALNKTRVRRDHWNFASAAFGAKILSASNEHYSPASQVLSPFEPLHMFDGMESARSRVQGHYEEVVIQLAEPLNPTYLELNFSYFINNNPKAVSADGWDGKTWQPLILETSVKEFAGNRKRFPIKFGGLVERLRIRCHPDGGINRIILR
jgi:allantoicase